MTPDLALALLAAIDATLALVRVRGCVHQNDVALLARVESALVDARRLLASDADDDADRLERLAREVLGR